MESSPATATIRNHKNETYLVFMDETFRAFFGLEQPKGYLCYSAVGIPENEYAYVTRSLARIFTKYEAYVVGDSGIHLKEFKFEDFKKLQRDRREEIAGQNRQDHQIGGRLHNRVLHACYWNRHGTGSYELDWGEDRSPRRS